MTNQEEWNKLFGYETYEVEIYNYEKDELRKVTILAQNDIDAYVKAMSQIDYLVEDVYNIW